MDWLVVCGGGAVLLGALAYGVDRNYGGTAPRLVSALWFLSLARLIVPPFVASPWGLVVLEGAASPGTATDLSSSAGEVAISPFEGILADWILVLWLAGVVLGISVHGMRLAASHRKWSRVSSVPPTRALQALYTRAGRALRIKKLPELRITSEIGPACVGLVRPWIALPNLYAADRDRDHLECVLLHELSHWRRRDSLRRTAIAILRCVFWFHPVAWIAEQRLRVLSEFDCDRRASRVASGGAHGVRSALLRRASYLMGDERVGAAHWIGHSNGLVARLEALSAPRPSRKAGWTACLLVVPASILSSPRTHLSFEGPHDPVAGAVALAQEPAGLPSIPAPKPAPTPPLDELQGCLQKRYAVMAALAEQRRKASRKTNP